MCGVCEWACVCACINYTDKNINESTAGADALVKAQRHEATRSS